MNVCLFWLMIPCGDRDIFTGFIRSLEILEKFGISKVSLQDLEKS
jgi:hypothetical protein